MGQNGRRIRRLDKIADRLPRYPDEKKAGLSASLRTGLIGCLVSIASAVQRNSTAAFRQSWLTATIVLAAGLSFLGLLFQDEVVAAVKVWIDSRTYNHCFLVLPLVVYLTWCRRGAIATMLPNPTEWFVLGAIPVAACWFIAERIGVMEVRQFLVLAFVQVLFVSVLGWRLWRALSASLLFLLFLIPFGEYLEPILQGITLRFITVGLDILGIVNITNGVTIEIPEGSFSVTEACAGLRFLIASIAFGGFYACLMYTGALRRFLFMVASTIVPVIANGLRALGIVLLGHYLGSAEAAATDHILYGWLFFSLVTFLLIVIGLPFREQLPEFVEQKNYVSGRHMIKGTGVALMSLCAIAAVPRLLVDKFDNQSSADTRAGELRILAPSGCQEASAPRRWLISPPTPGIGNFKSEAYRCGADLFIVTVRNYPMRIGARPVFTDLRADVTEPGWSALMRTNIEFASGPLAHRWSETQYVNGTRFAAIASRLWVDGLPEEGMRARLKLALRGSEVPALVAIVSYAGVREPDSAQRAFSSFLSEIKFAWAGSRI